MRERAKTETTTKIKSKKAKKKTHARKTKPKRKIKAKHFYRKSPQQLHKKVQPKRQHRHTNEYKTDKNK